MTENDRESVERMLAALDLSATGARTTEDIFTGPSLPTPRGRVYGGQVLAQSIVAASRTVATERSIHSMHGYFLRPGDANHGLTFAVDRIHDGRSFATRRAQAFQQGVPIFSMISSFQDDDPGLDHQEPFPTDVPDPDQIPPEDKDGDLRLMFLEHPVEVRHVSGPMFRSVDGEQVPEQAVWLRTRLRLPDTPLIHRAALAYISDFTIQEPILRAHGVPWAQPGLKVASLDHAMWWHRFGRVDEWLLYVQSSPSARGGRGLATGRIYTRDGVLVASVAQEVMVRVPAPD